GLMSTTGEPDGQPMRAGASVIDMTTGLYAALGALTALLEREVSGKGQWVQTSLLHAGIALMDYQAARYLIDGEIPGRVGNDHPTSMPTSTYATADGHLNIGVGGDVQWRARCKAFGQPELALRPEFLADKNRAENRALLNQILGRIFATQSTAKWVELLDEADVPNGPIYTMDQVFADPQVGFESIAEGVEHSRRGPIRLISQVAKLSRTPGRIASTLEDKGDSTQRVLLDAGFSVEEIDRLVADHAV
ncbi:MAG: CoA-transferase, partial [Rhizobacter sp.]|nr:CoA-transferase [Rhizobacter sp.]